MNVAKVALTQPPVASPEQSSLVGVARELLRLEERLSRLEGQMRRSIDRVPVDRRESARNLVHYVALRQEDLRDFQLELAQLGLSSLGRSEGCVRGSVLQVSRRAHEVLAFRGDEGASRQVKRLTRKASLPNAWQSAKHYLHRQTREILGPRPEDRHIYVMVTAPSAREADRTWMATMLRAGMNVLRINCAHDTPREWRGMVKALADARRETGRECRILMDLAGPKIRTGPVAGVRNIVTWKPARDDIGRPTAPARVTVVRSGARLEEVAGPTLRMDDTAFARVRHGDELHFRDARGKKRAIVVHEVDTDSFTAYGNERAYVLGHARAQIVRGTSGSRRAGKRAGEVTFQVGAGEGAAVDVRQGDELVLTTRARKGSAPRRDLDGSIVKRGVVVCTLPAALDLLGLGHRVLFDDGCIEAVVEKKGKKGEFVLRVVHTQKAIVKLRAEKGINLPDTVTTIPALTEDDAQALEFVARHADAVSLSFVRRPEDVRMLHAELDRLGRGGIGVVLKIETRAGFENLPRLLLEGLRRPPLAVMIARGDLAAEVGYERLAEVQEEILWLCEAAHVPAIWATQVLDTLARTGVPSRAEVTDAAASVAAECVMLNKGPFVDEAVRVLSSILRRMEKHRYKKRSLYRKLRVSTFAEA